MAVQYEWDVETVSWDEIDGDQVIDHYHCVTFKEALQQAATTPEDGCRHVVVLVRDDVAGRLWAYVDDIGRISPIFRDSQDNVAMLVPQKYLREVLTA
jgi:formate dehydrogenase assembly factor FdhD